ncbi:putative Ig domain-containing protein [Spirosoma sp. BT702]|uniref:Ig domain-containing protein n=1 Tax=Spirosoma profusum TaxID=2771354 RepID=A0A927AW15_9BACT|nr:putative Ig domain-containing protein [Spirosoma profusum]MBD2705498.1 putative Ig domain-containing protein [Spirosoma profusum]
MLLSTAVNYLFSNRLVHYQLVLFTILIVSGLTNVVKAQTPSFTTGQIEEGTGCDRPFPAVATNPVDGKIYGFWQKGVQANGVYKLFVWNGSNWSTVGTFTTATGTGSTVRVPNFDGVASGVMLSIDATGTFHVVFNGYRGDPITGTKGIWYGVSPNGTSWTFTEIQTVQDLNGFTTLNFSILEVDNSNVPHIACLIRNENDPRTYTLRYFRKNGNSWTGENAFSQSGGFPSANEITRLDLAVDGNNKAHIAFQRETNGTSRDGGLWYINNTSDSWSTPTELAHGETNQQQGETITIDTDLSNNIHIIYSDYQENLYHATNESGTFVKNKINALTGTVFPHSLRFNTNGDKFFTLSGLRYAYQFNGITGDANWTNGTAYTSTGQAGSLYTGLLTTGGRIMMLFDNLLSGSCSSTNSRNLWYATAQVSVPVAAPTFTQQPNATSACSGTSAVFTASATNATSFQWQESTNATFTSFTTLSSSGIYTVTSAGSSSTLTITTNTSVNGKYYRAVASNAGGSINSSGATLSVRAKPDVTVNTPAAVCSPATVNLTTALTADIPNSSFQYFTDAAGNQPVSSPTAVSVSGTYYGRAISPAGCVSDLKSISVTVNPRPTVSLIASGSLSCAQPTVTLTASSTSTGTYVFSGPSGVVNSTNGIAQVSQPGTYTVTFTAAGGATGCTASNTIVVNGNTELPSANLANDGPLSCTKVSVTLTASSQNVGVQYNFSGPGSIVQNGNTASITQAGTYTVTVTGQNSCTATAITTVNSDTALPSVGLSNDGPLSCTKSSITLTASGGSTYRFSTGANQIGGNVGNTATVTQAGLYSVTVISGNGCTAVASTSVSADQDAPAASLQNNGPLTCSQTSVTLTASGGIAYRFGGGAVQIGTSPMATVSVAGVYSVTVTGANGCSATAQTTVTSSTTLPAPTLTASALSTTNQPISVTATSCQGMVSWLPQGGAGVAQGNIYTFSQPGNYTLSATCSVGSCTSPPSPDLVVIIRPGGFAITSVTMQACQLINAVSGLYRINFTPLYSGQNSNPISFSIVNELLPTTNSGPYTLTLYNDNPAVTLVAAQSGNGEVRFRYNWLAACTSGTVPNRPPVTTGVPSQTLLQGQAYQLQLTDYFSDPDQQSLTFSANNLPSGLSLTGNRISGTPSVTGVSTVTITVLDPDGLSASATFVLTITSPPTTPGGFAIAGVSLVNCTVLTPYQRQLSFNPQYTGLTGQPVSFSIVNELLPTTNPGPYTLTLYTDNPVINLRAQQGNTLASYAYNWLSACTTASRQGANIEADILNVNVLGNPVEGQTVEIEVTGISGQQFQVELMDSQGRQLHQEVVNQASTRERVRVPIQSLNQLIILQISTSTQRQTVKLLSR